MNTPKKIATILLKGGIAPLTEIASGNPPIPRNGLSSPHGIAPLAEIASGNPPIPRNGPLLSARHSPPLRRLPPAILLSPATVDRLASYS